MDIGALLDGAGIAITGGSGFLGRALVADILGKYRPRRLVVISRGEARQAEMKQRWPETESGPLRYFVGDVRSSERMLDVFESIDIVIHAAALKRVEVCEREPKEAILTNVMGTLNCAEAARQRGVQRFLLVSSDKASAAATTYGGTKYVAERLVVGMNNYRGSRAIRYSCVRYGNVLGSTGSVLSLFSSANGTVPITSPAMSRFWWPVEDAARFVLSSLSMMRGGEVFVPKLRAMSVLAMAKALAPNAVPEYIGLRGPEKLAECMISADESPWTMELPDRYVLMPALPFWSGASWPEAKRVPEGWRYTSSEAEQIRPEEMLAMAGIANGN